MDDPVGSVLIGPRDRSNGVTRPIAASSITWVRSLFRVDAAPPAGWRRSLITLIAVTLGGGVLLLRQGWTAPLDTVYAEDGTIFLEQALVKPGLEALVEPYAGYLHLVPRLLAELAAVMPLGMAAEVLAIASSLAVAACALLVFHATRPWIASAVVRGMLAASVVLVPVGQEEVLSSAANVHWFLLFAGFLALVWLPRDLSGIVFAASVVFLAVTSDVIFALVALPVAFLRVFGAPRGRDQVVVGSFVVGLLLQLAVAASADGQRSIEPLLDPLRWAGLYLRHVVLDGLFGSALTQGAEMAGDVAMVGLAALVVLFVAIVAVRRLRDGTLPSLSVACLLGSVAFFVVPVALSGLAPPRYAVAPALLLYAAVALILAGDRHARNTNPTGPRAVALAAAVAALFIVGSGFAIDTPRTVPGPRWDGSLAQASASCGHGGVVHVPIVPEGAWSVTLGCDRLVRSP